MQVLPLEKLGPREVAGQSGVVEFGLFLPWVSAVQGNPLYLKIIHEQDQFRQQIQPCEFELSPSPDPVYGDYCSVAVDLPGHPLPHPGSAWGSPGRYVYRYYLAVSPEKSGREASKLMHNQGVFIAMGMDENGKPMKYVNTGYICNLLRRFE